MATAIKKEVKTLCHIGINSVHSDAQSFGTVGLGRSAEFILCTKPGYLVLDLYSWERDISGISNDGPDWDVDICAEMQVIIPFEMTRTGFRKAFRLARLCVRVPEVL